MRPHHSLAKIRVGKILLVLVSVIAFFVNLFGQEDVLKEQAIAMFKRGDYAKAIGILEQAKRQNANDAEIYYYLGYFSHYLAYDSRPLIGYDPNYSDKVLRYLNRTIELDPGFGDAYYFIGAEYGAKATQALRTENLKEYRLSYQRAHERGAFPAWLIEYAKNALASCEQNALLFVGGDAEFNPTQYLQTIQNYRQDVTVIPIGFLNRPWYVKKLREGVGDILQKAPIGLSDAQISDLHPYKWDTLTIEIPISEQMRKQLGLSQEATMRWELKPDLRSDRRTYLSATRAVLANIVETNRWVRPIYFSLGCNPSSLAGLNEYFQLHGLANKLLPIKTRKTRYSIDAASVARILLDEENVKDFKDVHLHNMPRVSNILFNYYAVLSRLAAYYKEQNQSLKISELVDYMKKNLLTDTLPKGEKIIKTMGQLSKK
ncbi:MAG: tetratricopeptide repeat protein [bacterium]